MNRTLQLLLASACAVILLSTAALAQAPANPLAAGQKMLYSAVKDNLIRAAEKMPEENYGFKATPEVRSFGQLLGHVADTHYNYCAVALGEKNQAPAIEKNKTSKADLVAALKQAFAYCDKAYDMTDAQMLEKVAFRRGEYPKVTVLAANVAHDNEHYGNVVTYMRLKGLVPPSSEPRP